MANPSKYDPKFIPTALELLGLGHTITALAGALGVNRSTLYDWAEAHPEWREALEVGQARSALFWEGCLRTIAQGGGGNATAAIFALKNRCRHEWADSQQNEQPGSDRITRVEIVAVASPYELDAPRQ